MKITKTQLRQIIKEELENVLNEGESMKDLQDSVAELEIRLKRRRAALEKLKAMDPDEQRDKDIKKLEDEIAVDEIPHKRKKRAIAQLKAMDSE